MPSDAVRDPAVQLVAGLLLVTVLLEILLRRMLKRVLAENVSAEGDADPGKSVAARRRQWFEAVSPPLSLLVWYYGTYAVIRCSSPTCPWRNGAGSMTGWATWRARAPSWG